jgi:hypothetical protein
MESKHLKTIMTASAQAQQKTRGYNTRIPQKIMTPEKVKTSIGTLEFFDGLPSKATSQKVYDYLDMARGVETFLKGIPATSVEGLRLGWLELGAKASNHVVIFDKLADSNPLFLTANTDTVYAWTFLDLKTDGPTVVEVPPKTGPGTVDDAYFRFVVDMGAPGPDRGAGGKYLILPPDYKGELKPTAGAEQAEVNGQKYFVAKSPSYVNIVVLRGFLEDGKPDAATAMFKGGLKIYPLAQAGKAPAMEFISASGKAFNTIHANTYEFYEELHTVIEREPVDMPDATARTVRVYRHPERQAIRPGRTDEKNPHGGGRYRQCCSQSNRVPAAAGGLHRLSENCMDPYIRRR